MFGNPLDPRLLESAAALAREFYQRPTSEVAADLLGKLLLRRTSEGAVAVRLVEVEAYLGPRDPACHTYGGRRTARVATMWGDPGHAYVYLIYGLHHCLNVVTAGRGAGEAVLLRGGIVVHGHELVRQRRGPRARERSLTDGPGKLCQALAVDRSDDGVDVCDAAGGLWLADDGVRLTEAQRRRGPRVGVESSGHAAKWPMRYVAVGV